MTIISSASRSDHVGPLYPVFPLEVFQLIIEAATHAADDYELSRFDITSLSLVCRAFHKHCRPYLFRDVEIKLRGSFKSARRLAALIEEQPILASFMHNVSWVEDFGIASYLKDSAIPNIQNLFHLPSVQSLKLGNTGYYYNYERQIKYIESLGVVWPLHSYISSGTLTTLSICYVHQFPILQVLSCPTLVALKLDTTCLKGWDAPASPDVLTKGFKLKTFEFQDPWAKKYIPFSLLAYCSHLEELDVFKYGLSEPADPKQFPMSAPPNSSFERVTSIKSQGVVDWSYLCSLGHSAGVKAFPALKRLHFIIRSARDATNGPNLIFQHISTLEELTLEVDGVNDLKLMDLGRCLSESASTLRTISIAWALRGYYGPLIENLCDAMEAVSHANTLQSISLKLSITSPREELFKTRLGQWKRLNSLLTNDKRAGFPHMREVRIILDVTIEGWGSDTTKNPWQFEKALKDSLHQLLSTPEIDVICQVDDMKVVITNPARTSYLQPTTIVI